MAIISSIIASRHPRCETASLIERGREMVSRDATKTREEEDRWSYETKEEIG